MSRRTGRAVSPVSPILATRSSLSRVALLALRPKTPQLDLAGLGLATAHPREDSLNRHLDQVKDDVNAGHKFIEEIYARHSFSFSLFLLLLLLLLLVPLVLLVLVLLLLLGRGRGRSLFVSGAQGGEEKNFSELWLHAIILHSVCNCIAPATIVDWQVLERALSMAVVPIFYWESRPYTQQVVGLLSLLISIPAASDHNGYLTPGK